MKRKPSAPEDTEPREPSKDEAQRLVDEAGSIDRAGKQAGYPIGKFRAFCKQHGITAKKAGLVSVFSDDQQVTKEALLEQEVKELRAQVRQMSELAVRDQRLLDYAADTIPTLKPKFRPARVSSSARRKGTAHESLLLWSDLHAGEVVDPDQVHGVNSYDWAEMLHRHDLLTKSLLSFRDHRPYDVGALRIACLGDMVSGDIHAELSQSNEMIAIDVAFQLGLDMARWIENLVPEFPRITLDCVVGNHGRLTVKPTAKNVHANWDWVFYKFVEQLLQRYETVTVTAPRSAFHHMRIFDRTLLLWHGDGVRSSTPGVPWGGVLRRAKSLESQFSHLGPIAHHLIGHWHSAQAVDDLRILVNGSIKGPDEYSLKAYGGGTPPMQLAADFHPTCGLTEIQRLDLASERQES